MDATTKQKTLSGVLVALLVGSVFLAAVPTAFAQSATAAVVDDRVSHVETIVGVSGTTYTPTVNNITSGGALEFNRMYDLTLAYMNGTIGSTWILEAPGAGTPGSSFVSAFVNPRNGAEIAGVSGQVNVTFPGVTLNKTGVWRVINATGANSEEARFFVSPVANLVVGLSQSSFPVTDTPVTFTVTVSPLAAGERANLTGVGIPPNTTVDGPTGIYHFVGPLSERGSFPIRATRDLNNDDVAEYQGTATYTVTSVQLKESLVSSTGVRSGFMGDTVWNITYPTGNAVFGPSASTRLLSYNLSVTGPNAFAAYANMTCDGSFSTTPTERNQTVASSCSTTHADAGVITWSYNANGNWTFSPNTTWGAGTYNFVLAVNTAGTVGSPAEYERSWSFTPATPADINLDLNVASTGNTVTAFTVQAPGASTTPSTGPAGSYTLNLTVTGTSQASHPTTGAPDSFASANVSITGDVILLGTTPFSAYNASTGVITLTGIVPTKEGGSVTFTVTWKGKSAAITVPITQGAGMNATKNQIVVDQATTLEFTVVDQEDNPIPDATITVFEKDTVANSAAELTGYAQLKGNGTTGYGRLGKYTLAVTPTTIGRFIAVATIGQGAPGPEGTRYAYVEFAVVPAHDIAVTLNRTTAMASDPTSYSLNATIANGAALGSNAQIYILNEKQYSDLVANGSLVSPGQSTGTVASITAPAFAFPGSSDVRGYNFTVALAPGTYRVYVCGNVNGAPAPATSCADARHDNNQSLPNITVSKFTATFSPDRIADNPNIQNNQSINVTVTDAAGNPWYGTLTIDSSSAGVLGFTNRSSGAPMTTFSLSIVNGTGSFKATGVGQGAINFRFDPDPSGVSVGPATASSLVDGVLTVVGPNVQVTPERFPLGVAQTLVITVKALDGTALPNLSVKVCGTPIGGNDTNPECTGSVTTNADGMALVGVNPSSTGNLTLYVNNVATPTKVIVFAGLVITHTPTAPVVGDTVTITVKDTAGVPQAGVLVNYTLPGNSTVRSQNADSNGQIVIANVPLGNITVTASKPLFDVATTVIRVGQGQQSAQAHFELSDLELPTDAIVGQQTFASVVLSNTGTASGSATVTFLVDGRPAGQQTWNVDAGEELPLDFGFTPTRAGTFEVEVRVTGGESITGTVTIVTPTVTPPTPTTTTTPPTGTTTTPPTGATTPPTGTTTTPPTSTTTTTTSPATPEPEVPGFEVVGLLAALGVALLVLRRRS